MSNLDASEPGVPTVLDGIDELKAAVRSHLGFSSWLRVGEEQVTQFLRATSGQAGPITDSTVPEHLILSLSNYFLPLIVEVRGFSMGVNYGTDSVRFPGRLAIGERVRAGVELRAVNSVTGGVQTTMVATLEAEDRSPVCVAHALNRYLF